jgi:hypothetical protein
MNMVIDLEISARAATLVADIRARAAADPRVVVDRKAAQEMLGLKESRILELERDGALSSFLDGGRRLISVDSIYRHLIEQVIASHPLGAPPRKARIPSGAFKKIPRLRTEAELRGLAIGNEKRKRAAAARRAARQTSKEHFSNAHSKREEG